MEKYFVTWETEHDTGEIVETTLDRAIITAKVIYTSWIQSECEKWKNIDRPTKKEKDNFNYMIHTCYVSIKKYDNTKKCYFDFYEFSDSQLEKIGWKLI